MLRLFFLLILLPIYTLNVSADQKTIHTKNNIEATFEIIIWFKGRLYAMAETTGGSLQEWQALESKAIERLKRVALESPNSLNYTNKNKMTPLIHASILGYDFLVEELLKHENVKNNQHATSKNGLTSLNFAIMASRQSIFACNPEIMTNTFALVPRLVTLPYYETNEPYKNLLTLLEIEKYPESLEETRQFMLKNCSNPVGYFRHTVKNSKTLQADLIKLGKQTIEVFDNSQKR